MSAHQCAVARQVPSFERTATHKVNPPQAEGTCDGATYKPPDPPTCVPLECRDHTVYDCPDEAKGYPCKATNSYYEKSCRREDGSDEYLRPDRWSQ